MAEFIKLTPDTLYRIPSTRPGFSRGLKNARIEWIMESTGLFHSDGSNPMYVKKRDIQKDVSLFWGG